MKKSLITRLNASVNRTDLPVLGKIRMNITGTDNTAQLSGITGLIEITGSSLTWNGDGKCTINTNDNNIFYINTDKTSKGTLFVDNKYSLKSVITSYAYGVNVDFADINEYCTNITSLNLDNSEQEGDLSTLKDLSQITKIIVSGSKVSGDIRAIKNITNLTVLGIANTSIACDLSYFTNCNKLILIDVSNTSTTGNLSVLAALDNIEIVKTTSSGVMGDLALFANKASFKEFDDWYLRNTWDSDSLRPSSMSKITGAFGFETSADTDNFLKNMAKCSDEGVTNKVWYFQNSHRTNASNMAVSTLQNAGYTLSQLITD